MTAGGERKDDEEMGNWEWISVVTFSLFSWRVTEFTISRDKEGKTSLKERSS